jgi:hypothetical protein
VYWYFVPVMGAVTFLEKKQEATCVCMRPLVSQVNHYLICIANSMDTIRYS